MAVLNVTSREGRFPNGLRVIVETVEESEVAGVALAVDAGSAKDPEGQGGLAHLVEHNVFESRHGEAPSVEQRLNRLAARYNAGTSHDGVVYHAFAPVPAFDGLLQVFADIAAEPLANLDSAAFEHERQVVEAERGLRTEHVQGQIAGYLYDAIFPQGHPYGRPVLGTRDSVAALQLGMAQAFVAANYRPEKMTMYVIAPRALDPFARVSKAFETQTGGLAPAEAPPTSALPRSLPLSPLTALVEHQLPVPTPELWLAWPLPASTIEERARAKALNRLVQELIRPSFTSHRAVAGTNCDLAEQRLGSILSCRLVLNDADDVDGVIDRTLADLRSRLQNSKNDQGWSWSIERDQVVSSTLTLESLELRATAAAAQAGVYGNPFLDRDVLGAFSGLDLGTVSSLGYELADRKRTHAMLIRPSAGAAVGPRSQQETRARRELERLGDPPSTEQTLALVRREKKRELTQFVLQNGLTVLTQRRRGTPFVSAVLGFRGSSAWATDPALGEAVLLSESWQVDSSPSQVGLSLHWAEGQDDRHFVARAVAPDLDPVLKALVRERYPHFDWPNQRFRRMLPALTRAENGYDMLAIRRERTELFGSHPYSAFVPAALAEAVTTQAVDRFFLSMRRPDNAVLVIVSDSDPSAVKAGVENYFGDWAKPSTAKLSAPPAINLQAGHPPTVVVVDKPSSQVDLRFSCLLDPGTGKARIAEQILAETLWARARLAMRAQTGIAYFAGGRFAGLAAGVDEISLSTSVDLAHVGQALSFLKQLSQLRVEEINDGDLSWQRFQDLEATAFYDQTTASAADWLYQEWVESRPIADLDDEQALIAGVTRADLAPPLATCTSHAVIVAIGNGTAIASADRP